MSTSSIKFRSTAGLLFAMTILLSCQREVVEQYQINEVNLYSSASEKKNLKTDEQFISILYTDLFGKSIDSDELKRLNTAYTSMGDKTLVIDIMIRGMLSSADAVIADENTMRARPDEFIEDTYKRFLVRKPTEQEKWFLRNKIENNQELKPIDVYYALLTADEYRYY